MARDMSMGGSSMSAKFTDGRSREFFWGCELSTEKPEIKWSWDEEDDDKEYLEHTLFIRHALLGAEADIDERHIIEIETKDFQGKEIKHPIVSLGKGSHMVSMDLNFSHEFPVTFRLIKGEGPIHLAAQQMIEFPAEEDDEAAYDTEEGDYTATETEELEDEEGSGSEDDGEPKGKGVKRKAGKAATATLKKKGKMDLTKEDDDDEDEDEDEEKEVEEDEDEESMDAEEDEEESSEDDDESSPEKKKKGKGVKAAGKKDVAPKSGKKPGKEAPGSKGKGKKEKAGKKKSK